MDPKHDGRMMLAPARGGAAVRLPGRDDAPRPAALPPLDEHLIRPETREEMVRGRVVEAMPSLPPHGDQHFRLDYVIGAYLKPGFVGSTDMLTRSSEQSSFATDTSVRKAGIDPRTEERYLEELSFEVVYEQSMQDITARAEDLTARGVRRFFAIFVKKGEVREWSAGAWKTLGPNAAIHDPCLTRPLTARDLLDAGAADSAVARALVEKNNPVIAAALQEGRREAHKEGQRQGQLQGQLAIVVRQFERRIGRALTNAERATLGERLDRLGPDAVDDARDAHAGEALAAWLAN